VRRAAAHARHHASSSNPATSKCLSNANALVESFAPHHLEADRVNERESLIGEAVQPAEHRISREVRRNLDPFVDRIVQEVQHRGSCLLHIAQVQKVGMELAEDQRRTDELPARHEMPLRNVDGPRVILIAAA
jgi:hypothetical protein